MKYSIAISLSLLFYSCSTPAQTTTSWTINRVRDSVLLSINPKIAAIQSKQAVKDVNDNLRNTRIDLLFSENAQLKKSNDSLKLQNVTIKKIIDDNSVILSPDNFVIDSVTKVATIIPDTFLVIKKSTRGNKFQSLTTDASSGIEKKYTLSNPLYAYAKEIEILKMEIKKIKKTIGKQKETIDKLKKQ